MKNRKPISQCIATIGVVLLASMGTNAAQLNPNAQTLGVDTPPPDWICQFIDCGDRKPPKLKKPGGK